MLKSAGVSCGDGAQSLALARASQVNEQVQVIDKNLCELSGWVDDLEHALSVVLREEGPMPCENVKEDAYLVPHADALRSVQRRIAASAERVRSMLNRLEL